ERDVRQRGYRGVCGGGRRGASARPGHDPPGDEGGSAPGLRRRSGERQQSRSEEHTSELQSLRHLVCRLLLEKKNIKTSLATYNHNICIEPLTLSSVRQFEHLLT